MSCGTCCFQIGETFPTTSLSYFPNKEFRKAQIVSTTKISKTKPTTKAVESALVSAIQNELSNEKKIPKAT